MQKEEKKNEREREREILQKNAKKKPPRKKILKIAILGDVFNFQKLKKKMVCSIIVIGIEREGMGGEEASHNTVCTLVGDDFLKRRESFFFFLQGTERGKGRAKEEGGEITTVKKNNCAIFIVHGGPSDPFGGTPRGPYLEGPYGPPCGVKKRPFAEKDSDLSLPGFVWLWCLYFFALSTSLLVCFFPPRIMCCSVICEAHSLSLICLCFGVGVGVGRG